MNIPELAHYQYKEIYPAFIRVYDHEASEADYYFAYDADGFCRGAYPAKYSLIRAFADAAEIPEKQGFENKETIYPGYYQAATGKFFKLNCENEFTFSPLGLFKMNVTGLGEEIELNVIPELVGSVLEFDYAPIVQDVYRDENVFFNLKAENVERITVTHKHKGSLIETRRYLKEQNKYVNYCYQAAEDESGVLVITAEAENIFSGEFIQNQVIIILENSKPHLEQPTPSTAVYEGEGIKIVKKQFKKFGEYLFVEGCCFQE